jgi:hypothetical protein
LLGRVTAALSLEISKELEAEIAEDKNRYSACLHMEEEIIQTTSRPGFGVAHQRVRLLWKQKAIAERIRKKKIMQVGARN